MLNLETLAEDIKKSYGRSYSEFIEFHNQLLSQITEKAQLSSAYKGRIKKISSIEDLNELPITPYEFIHQCLKEHGLEKVLLKKPTKYWQTSGHSGEPKKFYYGIEDVEKMMDEGSRLAFMVGIKPGDVGWNLGAGEPYLSGSVGTIIGKKFQMQIIITPMGDQKDLIKGLKQVSKADKIDVIFGIPLVFLTIGEIVKDPDAFKRTVKGKIEEKLGSLKFLSKIIANIYLHGIDYKKIKETLERTKIGVLFGEPIRPHLKNIKKFFPNMKVRDGYGSTELIFGAFQLSDDPNLSVLLNWFIPEIANPEEIMKAKHDPNYKIDAIPWNKWEKGMRGELIITRPGECLPLIRYPTGDLIEVINPAETHYLKVGNQTIRITLPSIKILGRSTDAIEFSTIEEMGIFMGAKIYNRQIQEAMARVSEHGKIKWWDLYVLPPTNEISFTKLKFEIIPETEIMDKEGFRDEVISKLRKECDELDYILKSAERAHSREFINKILEIKIAHPDDYKRIEKELERRIKQGRPMGQIKPKQIHILKSEEN